MTKIKKITVFTIFLFTTFFFAGSTASVGVYDPWADLNDDGLINIFDVVEVAGKYGTSGDPFNAKAAIEYDSSWLNITSKCGQYINIVHTFNSTEIMVDISGKTAVDGGAHQRNLGGTGLIPGWTQTYGGADPEYGHSVIPTVDGGYAIAGYTRSFGAGNFDSWLIKTDALGNHVWNQTYGGLGVDGAYCIIQTNDGGYVMAGETDSFGAGNRDFWLVKTDRFGDHVWNQTYGGTNHDTGWSVVQTSDGGYAIAGYTRSFGAGSGDVWLVKTDSIGNHQWNQTYGGTYSDYGGSMVQTSDGGYAIVGETDSFGAGSFDFWLVRISMESGVAWTDSTADTITLYRGATDSYWNYVRVRIWKIKETP